MTEKEYLEFKNLISMGEMSLIFITKMMNIG